MNGFSVCNKLKRDPALKDVPLIIMSSESTEETFEQHRRLRTRAEELTQIATETQGVVTQWIDATAAKVTESVKRAA